MQQLFLKQCLPEKFGNKNEVFAPTPKILKANLWLKCGLNCQLSGGQSGLNQAQGGGFEEFFSGNTEGENARKLYREKRIP